MNNNNVNIIMNNNNDDDDDDSGVLEHIFSSEPQARLNGSHSHAKTNDIKTKFV